MKHKLLFWKTCGFLFLQLILVQTTLFAQNVEVSGAVMDAALDEPLIGVNVTAKNMPGSGTITDIDGNFKLSVPGNSVLVVSYIGYEEQEIPLNGRTNLIIKLREATQTLNEIVVIGYGTQKKSDLTGSVAVVDMDEAKKLVSGSISEALQGQVAGVSVQSSGDPGNMGTIRIRGVGSFSKVGPLYVVDGLIVTDMNHINPADIESMQVLKDAASSAIYGSRGANGVIIVTTKKGRSGKPSLNVSANFGVQELAKKIEMKHSNDFLYYNQLAYLNAGKDWPAHPVAGAYIPDTDWQRAIFSVGKVQDYNASYSQGNDKVSMMMGAGYFSQDGVLEGPTYERFTYRVNTEGKFGIFKVGENLTLSRANSKVTNTGQSSFTNALMMPTVIPVYDPNEPSGRGGFGYGSDSYPTYSYNPVALQESIDHRDVNNRIIGNVYAELNILKVLTYKLNLGVDYWYGRKKHIDNAYTMRIASSDQRYKNILEETRDERMTTVMEHTLTYKQQFGKHNIEALAGYTVQKDKWHYLWAQGYDRQVEGLDQLDLVSIKNNFSGNEHEARMLSYLGRINYNYGDRYLLQMNIRADGSSRFGPDHRWGVFPSASIGWRISNEAFFEPLQAVVSNLKLRASYGKIGDQSALGCYDWIPSIDHSGPYEGLYSIFGPSGNETINEGAAQSSKANNTLGWETKTTFNIGVDFDLLDSRLYGTFEWFNSKSTDLLTWLPMAWATGVDGMNTNYGEMRNKGIELSLGWRDKKGDFSYNISANIAHVKNEVLKMGDAYREGGWNNINRTEKGRSVADFYLIKTDGIFQSMDDVFAHTTTLADGTVKLIQPSAMPGDVRYVDANGDGQIDQNDRQWCGSPLPKFEAGLNFNAAWKGIDFTMFWTCSYGNKIFNVQRKSLLNLNVDNIPEDETPWTWDNPSMTVPRPIAGTTDNNLAQVDRFLENGSYLRLKNLQLGYTLPAQWTKRISVDRCRIYISGQNLWTITKYKGYDPEVISNDVVYGQGNDEGGYPPVRTYNIGLQISF